ncbi:hypothetical protein IC235_21510 [Hymenobacter sp. BT664]|uniref:Uncharacterized protein n=1 Tax=Hymenobacter montanus TaxID=2771359 RepID=A0A927GLS6_9BACT|nr:hypothetical protein [Hymenobacter montanus]MBD2770471.1 hypothetical protein [Hymenobacter montanus]
MLKNISLILDFMLHRLPLVLLLTMLVACHKSATNPTIDFGEGEGITYRDGNNWPAGPQDPTDWQADATWNERERALFPDLQFDLNAPQRSNLTLYTCAYPNPAAGRATWSIRMNIPYGSPAIEYTVSAVFVSRNYKVVTRLGPRLYGQLSLGS